MITERSRAEMLALIIFSMLPEELTVSEAESVLLESGEFDHITAGESISELLKRGSLYEVSEDDGSARYVGISELGESAAEQFESERAYFSSAINRALRAYKKITTGIEYRVELSSAEGGSYVIFEYLRNGISEIMLRLFFESSHDALEVYTRIDRDPDGFYKGCITVATGKVDFIL